MDFKEKAKDFLSQKRIAVAGASTSGGATGNGILKALRDKGYEVFPLHPSAETVEEMPAYARVQDIPDGVDGVFIVTNPDASLGIVKDCAEAGVSRVWMHFNPLFGAKTTSVSEEAVAFCKEKGITVIDGGCPMMFIDGFHKLMRGVLGVMGKLPA